MHRIRLGCDPTKLSTLNVYKANGNGFYSERKKKLYGELSALKCGKTVTKTRIPLITVQNEK